MRPPVSSAQNHRSRQDTASSGASSDGAVTPDLILFTEGSHSDWLSQYMDFPDELPEMQPISVDQENRYIYSSISPDQIRLLLLQKGTLDDPIRVFVKTVSTKELEESAYDYYAISYVWGDDAATNEIFLQDVREECSLNTLLAAPEAEEQEVSLGESIGWFSTGLRSLHSTRKMKHVRPNLHAALKRLRSANENQLVWVDALCIDQENSSEKSSQLPKMLEIYSKACGVCIWLGEPEQVTLAKGTIHDPLDFINFIVNLKLLDSWANSGRPDKSIIGSFVAFANLLRRPWFRRRWVIQEVSASRQASVHYGDKKVNWVDFADAVQLFMAKIDRIRAIYRSSTLYEQLPDAFEHVESTGASAIVNAASSLVRKTQRGKITSRLWNIESLAMTFVHFEASDPRDTIYALLPLARDGHLSFSEAQFNPNVCLVPNYAKSPRQVYAEFVRHSVVSSGSLDIICRNWALTLPGHRCPIYRIRSGALFCRLEMPTWVGLVTDSPFGPPSKFTGRLNGDSFVGEIRSQPYKASQGTMPEFSLLDFEDENILGSAGGNAQFDSTPSDAGTLFAKGLVLGPITRVSSRIVDGTIPDECLRMAGWNNSMDVNQVPDCLWRTLVGDRTHDGRKAPSWWRRACMYCLTKANLNGDLSISKLNTDRSLPDIVISDYVKRVLSIVWNRKFFVCRESPNQSEWLIGLGSRYIESGDLVCILFGCSVPVVLRKVTGRRGNVSYHFVGECFVYEKMDGEALTSMDEMTIKATTVQFNIT
jgi:hypothetical protein